ncbi:MAG: hypothetical protein F6K58_02640 [Symploca sp. SIO2E9]|nr:hypothetical protein [Symploca sp. SIO2E9]
MPSQHSPIEEVEVVINEYQAEFLLSQCEMWLRTELHTLRCHLRGEHEQTKSHLWELIVLHATASAVISSHYQQKEATPDISSLIQPEGEQQGVPDICLTLDQCDPFWVEVAYLTPRNHKQETDIERFPYY